MCEWRELASSYNVGKSTFSRLAAFPPADPVPHSGGISSQNGRFDEGVVQNLHPS